MHLCSCASSKLSCSWDFGNAPVALLRDLWWIPPVTFNLQTKWERKVKVTYRTAPKTGNQSKHAQNMIQSSLSLQFERPLLMEDNYHNASSNVPSSSGSLVDWNFKRQVWIRKAEKRPQKDFLPHAHLLRVECGGGGQSNKGGADSIQRVWDQNIFFLGFYMFL